MVATLRAVHAARGENLETRSLDQLYITLELEDNRILQANPFLMTAIYDLVREFQDIFTSLECEAEETDLIEFPLDADRRSGWNGRRARVLHPGRGGAWV